MTQTTTAVTTADATPIDWSRVGGWAGLLFVATFALAAIFALAPAPAGSEGAEVIRQWAHDEGTVYLTSMWVATVMHLAFLLPFAAALSVVLDRHDRVLARLVAIAATAGAVTATVGTAFSASLTLGSAADLSDASVVAFWRADNFVFLVVLSGFQALMVAAAGVAVLRYRVLTRWLGPLGVAAGFILVVDGLWVAVGDFSGVFQVLWLIGLVGYAAWIVGASLWMVRHGT